MSRTPGYKLRHKRNEDILEELRCIFRPGLWVAREMRSIAVNSGAVVAAALLEGRMAKPCN
jgi:hypothetical protein